MDNINKIVYYNELFIIYGDLLTSSQKEVLDSYLSYNLSISEIAINKNISRAAIEDALRKGLTKLDYYEDILQIYNKKGKIIEQLDLINESNYKDLIKNIKEGL